MVEVIRVDQMDRMILDMLLENGRISHEEIGRTLNLSRPAVRNRIRKMEETGVIRGYRAELDWSYLGQELDAFVFVKGSGPTFRKVIDLIRQIKVKDVAVQRVSRISGVWCLLIEVRTSKAQQINAFIDKLWEIECIHETSTSFVLADYDMNLAETSEGKEDEESCGKSD